MLATQPRSTAPLSVGSYAQARNSRFSSTSSQIRTIKQRWDQTFNALPRFQQQTVNNMLAGAIAEFQRNNPDLSDLPTLQSELPKAYHVPMSQVHIDITMQRQLNIAWVMSLLQQFVTTKVMPIQVYQPDESADDFLAWDGQHTLVLLWLICTQIYGVSPDEFVIPVNVYKSHKKSEMRSCFIDLNSEAGKKMLDLFDKIEQMIYGVRADNRPEDEIDPIWVAIEKKQQVIESHGLFLTSKKFDDHDEPGAVSRLQEFNKMDIKPLTWLCKYLVHVGATGRAVQEKEMVNMAYFFDRCAKAKLNLTQLQIASIADLFVKKFGADFSPSSIFWARVKKAYDNWHAKHIVHGTPRYKKEPVHAYPFLAEQVKKDVPGLGALRSDTNSEFLPAKKDLY